MSYLQFRFKQQVSNKSWTRIIITILVLAILIFAGSKTLSQEETEEPAWPGEGTYDEQIRGILAPLLPTSIEIMKREGYELELDIELGEIVFRWPDGSFSGISTNSQIIHAMYYQEKLVIYTQTGILLFRINTEDMTTSIDHVLVENYVYGARYLYATGDCVLVWNPISTNVSISTSLEMKKLVIENDSPYLATPDPECSIPQEEVYWEVIVDLSYWYLNRANPFK